METGGLVSGGTIRVLGVDGCKKGWVGIALRDGAFGAAYLKGSLRELIATAPDASVIAVDIPIGCETNGFRRVDAEARTFVGPRWNSVFLVPPLEVFEPGTYEEACVVSQRLTRAKPSRQLWGLREKVLEAATLAANDPRLIEVHPEVSFRELNGEALAHPKKSWSGQSLRRRLLANAGLVVPEELKEAGDAAPDDILDATVAAWSAHRHASSLSRHLEPTVTDASGRTVTIWY